MPTFQSKTFRRATTASSSFGERLGAFYRARLTRHPFLLFGLPFMAVIVAGSFALTPAAALRYERYDRKVQQMSKEEAFELGLKGPDGEEGIKRNPRRRIIGDEREEYYVRALFSTRLFNCHNFGWHADPIHRDSWQRTWTIGNKNESSDSRASLMGGYNMN